MVFIGKIWSLHTIKLKTELVFNSVKLTTTINTVYLLYSLEELMLKFQYFDHLMWRADSLEKTVMLGNIDGKRRSDLQRMRWLDSITNSMDMNLSKCQERAKNKGAWDVASPWGHKVLDTTQWLNSSNNSSWLTSYSRLCNNLKTWCGNWTAI